MSDEVVGKGIDALSPYGPFWVILALSICALVIVAIALVPTIKTSLEKRTALKEREQNIMEQREQRKRDEMLGRAERDGQMIQLLSDSNRVIERNSQAFRQMTEEIKRLSERDKSIDESLGEMKDSIKCLDETVGEMRIDIAKIKGGA